MRLFRPAWDSKKWKRAVKAVEKITDEATLERIAKKARCWQAREAAVERLTNQSLLADVAKNDKDSDVRKAAVERLTDQSILADVAQNDEVYSVRQAAVERVTDQSVLVGIAKNNKEYRSIRIVASHRLVTYDLEEDLLMYIIHLLGDMLKSSDESAAETLLAYYRRYGTGKHGEEIRMYKGKYNGGYSDHTDFEDCSIACSYHTDKHTDTTYTIHFNPEEEQP
jgi:hypothetical protein